MNEKSIHLATVISTLMLLGSACWGIENQIINGEFDAGIEPWQKSPGDGYTIEVVQGVGLSGLNALKIDVSDVNAQESITITQGGFALEQGATYHIGFTAKADADRQIGVLLELDGSWAYVWHEWIDLTPLPQTFNFEYIHTGDTTENVVFYFIFKHSLFPLLYENENIDAYIDGVYVVQEPPADPNLAHYPWPPDGAIHEDTWICCSWAPGQYASTHDFYFSDNFDDVYNGTDKAFKGNLYDLFWITGFPDYAYSPGLIPGTTYYWRIDEVNDMHPDSPWKGDVWSFWLPPRSAYDPYPSDGTELIDPNVTLKWEALSYASSHEVYLGENADDVENGTGSTFKGSFSGTSYTPNCLDFDRTYYWRVDVFYSWGTYEKGEIWSFSTKPTGPNIAHDPHPADGAKSVDPNITLSWSSYYDATSYTVYFGDNFEDVNNANLFDGSGIYQGRSVETSYTPEVLNIHQIYYWRIDEVEADGVTIHKGNVWSFTVAEAETVICQVSASEDDGYAFNPSAQNLQTAYLKVGYSGFVQPPYYISGMVFRNVNIPQGSVILSARLKVRSQNSNLTDIVHTHIEAEATDDAASFSSSRRIDTLLTTNNFVNWIVEEPWSANTWYESPDIAGVIQEVIDRAGWSEGNSLAILLSTSSKDGYQNFSSYDRGDHYAPILEVIY